MKLIGIIIGAVIIFIVFMIMKGKSKPVIPTQDVDVLGMEDILLFFKQQEIISILKKDGNLLAVATREIKKDGTNYIIACLFDKSKDEISELDKNATAWNAKKLDNTDLWR